MQPLTEIAVALKPLKLHDSQLEIYTVPLIVVEVLPSKSKPYLLDMLTVSDKVPFYIPIQQVLL